MSKSLGNVISPYDLVKKYGTEATRYLLLRHVHSTEDTDVTWERLDEWYTAGLVNGIGNLVARVFTMAEQYGALEQARDYLSNVSPMHESWANIEIFNFNRALDHVWEGISSIDQFITIEKPFVVFKTDPVKARSQVLNAVSQLRDIATTIAPFMPETSKKILDAIKENKKPENLFPRLT